MKNILFPTDFSHNANRALEYAVEIAALTGATLQLLHVYTPTVSKTNIVSAFLTDEIGDATREAQEKLSVITDTIQHEYPNSSLLSQVGVGETNEVILETANANNIDLIIMGTLGASNLTKMIFGSNTAKIIEESNCPVLAVPSNCTYRVPKKILFATNFSYNDLEAVKSLALIGEAFKAEIILGHVDVSESDEEIEEHPAMDKFLKEAKTLIKYPRIFSKVVNDHNVSMGLDKIIEESDIDMFALSTHKRTWFEKISNPSLTKKISNYTHIPLLAFHNPIDEEFTGSDF
jgi:nucleotide-binding universal stress UspA family protein